MGTQSAKPFGNDTAADWLGILERKRDDGALVAAFSGILSSRGRPSPEASEKAIAAAAVVSAARRDASAKLPKEAQQWIARNGYSPPDNLLVKATQAVERILAQSELRNLWEEAGALPEWIAEMQRLLAELKRACATPPPKRKPQPQRVSGRIPLPKLVEGVKPDNETPLRDALREKLAALNDVNAVVSGTWEKTPLHLLADRGLVPEARALLDRGADPNPQSERDATLSSPLELACARGHAAMAQLLLERGAALYHKRPFWIPGGPTKPRMARVSPALYTTISSGRVETLLVLLQHGANLRAIGLNGETLLHHAADADQPAMIRLLVQRGLPLEHAGRNAMTALLWATLNSRVKSVAALLELGANPNATDSEGLTALDLARPPHKKSRELVALIRKHGGRTGKAKQRHRPA
jgi:hypothetical protein